MSFSSPVVGGSGDLIREQIKSPNYVPGISGWIIERDGDVEFNNLVARGEVLIPGDDSSEIAIIKVLNGGSLQPEIRLTPGDPAGFGGYHPGTIFASEQFSGDPDRILELDIEGPRWDFVNAFSPSIRLVGSSFPANATPAVIEMYGDTRILNWAGGTGNLAVNDSISNITDSMLYMRGQRGSQLITIAAATSFVQAVVFPTAFPAGVTPDVQVTINDGAGQAGLWIVRTNAITNTGFNIIGSRTAASALTNMPVAWLATVIS